MEPPVAVTSAFILRSRRSIADFFLSASSVGSEGATSSAFL